MSLFWSLLFKTTTCPVLGHTDPNFGDVGSPSDRLIGVVERAIAEEGLDIFDALVSQAYRIEVLGWLLAREPALPVDLASRQVADLAFGIAKSRCVRFPVAEP